MKHFFVQSVEKKHKGLCDEFQEMVIEQWEKHVRHEMHCKLCAHFLQVRGMLESGKLDVVTFERGIADDKAIEQFVRHLSFAENALELIC
jgi:hypothetical protein